MEMRRCLELWGMEPRLGRCSKPKTRNNDLWKPFWVLYLSLGVWKCFVETGLF